MVAHTGTHPEIGPRRIDELARRGPAVSAYGFAIVYQKFLPVATRGCDRVADKALYLIGACVVVLEYYMIESDGKQERTCMWRPVNGM